MSATGDAWLPDAVDDRTRLVEMGWGRAFVVDVGPGDAPSRQPPLVLLHGLFTTHFAFDRLVPRLATARRVVAIDLPGCGDSDHPAPHEADDYSHDWLADVVVEILGALDIGRFDLLGHDYGGAVGLALATRHAKRLRRLVLLGPLALSVSLPLTGTLSVMPALGSEVFRRGLRRADVRSFLAQGMSAPELVADAQVNVYWDRLGRDGAREATYAMMAQLSSLVRMRERFSTIDVPTAVVWGDRDRIVTPDQGERLVELLRKATLHVVEGCGHNPAQERPEELARLVEAHCGS